MKAKQAIIEKFRLEKLPIADSQPVETYLAVSSFDDQPADLLMVFLQSAQGLACQVYVLQIIEDDPEVLISILKNAKVISSWNWNRIPCAEEIESAFEAMNVQVAQSLDPSVKFGITGVDAALAVPGSVVLKRCLRQSTGPSHRPPTHIAVITEDQITPNSEVRVVQQQSDDLNGFQRSGNIVMVSGPGRTTDIAMQRILGMPGNKELKIIIFLAK